MALKVKMKRRRQEECIEGGSDVVSCVKPQQNVVEVPEKEGLETKTHIEKHRSDIAAKNVRGAFELQATNVRNNTTKTFRT